MHFTYMPFTNMCFSLPLPVLYCRVSSVSLCIFWSFQDTFAARDDLHAAYNASLLLGSMCLVFCYILHRVSYASPVHLQQIRHFWTVGGASKWGASSSQWKFPSTLSLSYGICTLEANFYFSTCSSITFTLRHLFFPWMDLMIQSWFIVFMENSWWRHPKGRVLEIHNAMAPPPHDYVYLYLFSSPDGFFSISSRLQLSLGGFGGHLYT